MFNLGKNLRYWRIFDSGTQRTVIVAMDHGLFMGPVKGLTKPLETVRKVLRAGANALIVSPGIVKCIVPELQGKAGLILRVDGAVTVYGPQPYCIRRIARVEQALKMGADAVIAMGYVGAPGEHEILRNLSIIARDCEEHGILLLAEMIPVKSEKIKDPFNVEAVSLAARVGAEIGADIIKTYYTGDKETFREVVEGCPVPIVVAGGPKMESEEKVLKIVREAIEAGSAGVAFGRNIWQSDDAKSITRAIAKIVHGDSGPTSGICKIRK